MWKNYTHPDAICTEDDCTRTVDCSDRAWEAGIRKCQFHWTLEGGFTVGPIAIEDYFTVMAQYMPRNRWNGWLMPSLDPHGVMVAIGEELINEDATTTYEWQEDLSLKITERDTFNGVEEEFIEILHPDEDGLYALGAGSWVWQEDPTLCPDCGERTDDDTDHSDCEGI